MFIARLRYQGVFIAGLFILVMLGSFLPDPFADPVRSGSTTTSVFKSAYEYFRFRSRYVALAPLIRGIVGYNLGSSLNSRVYIGHNHHLYYGEENAAAQSAGDIYRRSEVIRFADMAAILQRELRKDGADLIVAIAPNAQSVAVDDLPYRRSARGPLEYDLALAQLKGRGIRTSDIKSVLLAHGGGDALYRRTDTHWNNLGSLLAFNTVVSDAGHQQWKIAASVLGPAVPGPAGDLARFMGIQHYVRDSSLPFVAAADGSWEKRSIMRSNPYANVFDSYAYERQGASGARVLVLGDSFTQSFWLPLLKSLPGVSGIGWMHHGLCSFDFDDVRLFKPTLVILIPTERSMPCSSGRWPPGLSKE